MPHYQEARICWAWLSDHHWLPITTNLIVAETHALLLSRLGADPCDRFPASASPECHAGSSEVTVADEQRALAIIFQYADKGFLPHGRHQLCGDGTPGDHSRPGV